MAALHNIDFTTPPLFSIPSSSPSHSSSSSSSSPLPPPSLSFASPLIHTRGSRLLHQSIKDRSCLLRARASFKDVAESGEPLATGININGVLKDPENDSQEFDSSELELGGTAVPILGSLNGFSQGAAEPEFSQSSEKVLQEIESSELEWGGTTMPIQGSLSGSGHVGLFRTPISGGVQSATSSHGLPSPALAVRNLMEQARYAHLCTIMSCMHHRRRGYPFGSLVDFAVDSIGHPIFSLSPLAIHTRNLLEDPRCSLVVQIPGWSGLSNARVTIFGDVYPLSAEEQDWAHKKYTAKHQQGATQQWGNFYYYRMQSFSDIYFIGGFGTVAWVDVKEFENAQPDIIAANGAEQTLKELNAKFSRHLRDVLSKECELDDAALISIDSKGIDIRVRQGAQFNVQRLSFEVGHAVETLKQAETAIESLLDRYSQAFRYH